MKKQLLTIYAIGLVGLSKTKRTVNTLAEKAVLRKHNK